MIGDFERAAFREAQRLGHEFVGPEHGLLVVARGDPPDAARLALEEVGADASRIERRLQRMIDADPAAVRAPAHGTSPNPAWYRTAGRAEGFAAALGTGTVRPVDFLLAILWGPWPFTDEPPISREAVLAALGDRGAPIPKTPLPAQGRVPRFTQRVEFPRANLTLVIDLLARRHPPGDGPTYGFNHDGADRAWVVAEDGIDLRAIVDAAASEHPAV